MNVNDLITLTREYIDESAADSGDTGYGDFTDSSLLTFMNLEHKHVISMIRQVFELHFGREHIFLTVDGQFNNHLPREVFSVVDVEFIDGAGAVTGTAPFFTVDESIATITTVDPVLLKDKQNVEARFYNARNFTEDGYYLFEQQIRFGTATALGNGRYCRVYHIPTSMDLHRATATAGAATTITLGTNGLATTLGKISKINNYYQGAYIEIISGTGLGQINKVLSYNGTTLVATMAEAWVTTPDSTSVYSIVSPIPEDYTELLALGAAIRAKGGKTEDDTSLLGQMYSAIVDDMEDAMESRQEQKTRRVTTRG